MLYENVSYKMFTCILSIFPFVNIQELQNTTGVFVGRSVVYVYVFIWVNVH